MKTFLVYSNKPAKFITTNSDISNLKFIQYGFNWKYGLDLFSIFYAIRRKYYIFALAIAILYFIFSYSSSMQAIFLASLALIGTSIEFLYTKKFNKYKLIGTIEAKNLSDAHKNFIEQYILCKNKIFIKGK